MNTPFVRTAKQFGHAALYAVYKDLLPGRAFALGGKTYSYFYHPYNNTCETERSIEIPVALDFLASGLPGAVLEVGNVLNHYAPFVHTVVDKYEVAAHVVNLDIADADFPEAYSSIVSISTMEHVGWDEEPFDPDKAVLAISRLRKCLLPSGRMLITFPIGHNLRLDQALQIGSLGCQEVRGMKRTNLLNDWTEVSVSELMYCRPEEPYRTGHGPYQRIQGVAFAYFSA